MSVSLMLTYVPEKRGEVHSEHKPSTFSLSSKNEVFSGGLSLLGFWFIFSCVGAEEGQGQSLPNTPSLRPMGRTEPQHSCGIKGQPGVSSESGC